MAKKLTKERFDGQPGWQAYYQGMSDQANDRPVRKYDDPLVQTAYHNGRERYHNSMKKLDELCKQRGISIDLAIALAVDNFWYETVNTAKPAKGVRGCIVQEGGKVYFQDHTRNRSTPNNNYEVIPQMVDVIIDDERMSLFQSNAHGTFLDHTEHHNKPCQK